MIDDATMRAALLEAGWEEVPVAGVWRSPQKSWEDPVVICTTAEAYAFLRGETHVKHRIRRKKP